MPLYEYACEDCNQEFVLLQSTSTNKDETLCEHCGSDKTRPQISSCVGKVQGSSRVSAAKPVTAEDYPKQSIFNLPIPRHVSEI